MQDAGIIEISTNPEAYARYLAMQGDNPMYSAGNIALVMIQDPQATMFATADRWRALGRNVAEMERNNGVQIFARSPLGKGYTLTDAYDITQTTGRDVKRIEIKNNTPGMETALATLLNYSVVPVVVDNDLTVPAFYDSRNMELAIQPNFPDNEAFAAIATEIAQARFHNKGNNTAYNREECTLDAESVSYILCRRFGIDRDKTLQTGVGHLLGSSMPIGGESTHTILTGHSGMASQRMFTDLPQLNAGDVIYLHILDEVLAYQVYDTDEVFPHDTTKLQIERERDLCTLITCTPIGVNTHRLLVMAERIPYEEAEEIIEEQAADTEPASTWEQNYLKGIVIGIVIILVIALIALVIGLYRRWQHNVLFLHIIPPQK